MEVYRRFQGFFWFGGGVERGGYAGGTFLREFVMGEENFHEGRAGFTSIIKKKKLKNKSEKAFSAGSKEQQ